MFSYFLPYTLLEIDRIMVLDENSRRSSKNEQMIMEEEMGQKIWSKRDLNPRLFPDRDLRYTEKLTST
jgi:hypothetical protein